MKLRAVLESQKRLYEVVKALEKIGKLGCFLFSEKDLHLCVNPDKSDEAQTWAQLATDGDESIFRTYRIESKNQNQIAFEVDFSLFNQALKSAENAEEATIKLTKKYGKAYLSFEIIIQEALTTIQDVPVIMLAPEEQARLQEPNIGEPDVHLVIPRDNFRTLSVVADRLKGLNDKIVIRASMIGDLEMGIETEFVFLTQTWKNLEIAAFDGNSPQQGKVDTSKQAEAMVDANMLSRVLISHAVKPSMVICCMVDSGHKKLLLWHLKLGNDCLTYYLPVLE
mmetsp:Transcript_20266/g.31677  ORF Transcript_20266/g.31677 Transcript_20266/m.31677 type:complete len:281 (-) Transcript_20266:42-884(-)|eukprot:CAMPEP_0184305010 /NCGR_PEP_ID=MMETSP1049-20130417/14394_1 /TAXON_ID=77928 /ORGANISM="Proteomonas sulcata, Strain CCMP704" /LENGTH=280 /DNA_ID=CAMNT_0026616979 /DNA_START=59 /DNA_END=901 /DNA_ORIENTATION=+